MATTLIERDQKVIWHPFTQSQIAPQPIGIVRGQGSYLFTESGDKLFDGISSWWTNAHGHSHPDINRAISSQAQILEHVIFAGFTHEPAVKLAEILLSMVPKGLDRVFFSDNGSTAVEVAIKMAYQYWQHQGEHRPYFIALEHGYHGDTFGAMSVSERSAFTRPFWPLLFEVIKSKSPCVSEIDEIEDRSEKQLTKNALEHLAKIIDDHQGQIAGLVIEPMLQAAGGMRIFTKGFLTGMADLCRKNNILLIADEVATGFYRTGKAFACLHEAVEPDIMCLAKALTGGYLPFAVTLASEKIYRAFLSDKKTDALLHGHTFTANPLGCAAAIASMHLFNQPETLARISQIYGAIDRGIERFKKLSSVKNARSIGALGVIELKTSTGGYGSRDGERIFDHCLKNGLYIRPLGNIIYLMPPFSTTAKEIDWAFDVIYGALALNYKFVR